MALEIQIDIMYGVEYPHYCRDETDRARWFAYTLGYTRSISPRTEVTFPPDRVCFRMLIEEGDFGEVLLRREEVGKDELET